MRHAFRLVRGRPAANEVIAMSDNDFQTKFLVRLARLCSVLILVSCAKPEITPDSDSLGLVTMSEQARQIAQKEIPDVVLRQVDTDLNKTTFLFTDKAATKEIGVTVPTPNAPLDQWTAHVTSLSPLLGRTEPDMNLKDLRVAPSRVAQAITSRWSGCKVRALTLLRAGNDLEWVAFCDTPQGIVSGKMENRTGTFQPFSAPPARVPITAIPTR